jgi:hypothetical protein
VCCEVGVDVDPSGNVLLVAPGNTIGKAQGNKEWRVGGESWPDFTTLAGGLCTAVDEREEIDNPYGYLSGHAHAHPTFILEGRYPDTTPPDRPREKRLAPSPRYIDAWTRFAARAFYLVALGVFDAHGWNQHDLHTWYAEWKKVEMVS